MPRNLVLYGLAGLAGFILYGILRSLLGLELMLAVSLIALVVVGFVIYGNLKTNRKVAEATPEQRAEALAFAPVAEKAALYIYRNQFVGRAVGVNITVDGREVTQLKSPRFTRIALAPGARTLGGYMGKAEKPKGKGELALNANAGDVIVVRCAVEPQVIGSVIRLTRVELGSAQAELAKIRMVAPDTPAI